MDDVQHVTAVCEMLRTRVMRYMYGDGLKNFETMPPNLVRDLYPFDLVYLTDQIRELVEQAAGFDVQVGATHPFKHRQFAIFRAKMFDDHTGYDGMDLACQGLLAYRFDAYNQIARWAELLEKAYTPAVDQLITNRLAKALTILTIPDQLDDAYFTGAHAAMNQYSIDPAEVFTTMIDWFIDFLHVYGRLAKSRRR